MAFHKNAPIADIHRPYSFSYADETARENATGFDDSDIGKFCIQEDNNNIFILVGHTPTSWKDIADTGTITGVYLSAGTYELPSIVDNLDGTVTIGQGKYTLYNASNYRGTPALYTISGDTFAITADVTNYIIADYNGGAPILKHSLLLSDINDSSAIPVFTILKDSSGELHIVNWDEHGAGLANKLMRRFRDTQRFAIAEGFKVYQLADRELKIDSGIVWAAGTKWTLAQHLSKVNELHFFTKTAGAWVKTHPTALNNTQYCDGTNTLALGTNKYNVQWIYRGVENENHSYVILGEQYGSVAEAAAAPITPPPELVASHAVLVGRVIYMLNAVNAATVESVIATAGYVASPISNHSDLANIVGDGVYHVLNDGQSIVLDKGPGVGVKVDVDTPSWGWRDLEGVELVDTVGGNAATLSTYRGSIREFAFGVGDIMDLKFHMPHDYLPGSDMFIHVHWSHNGTAISGNFEFDFHHIYAKGHDQAAFSADKNIAVVHNTINITTTPQYQHMISEVPLSTPGGNATLLDTDQLEVDGLILVGFHVTAIPTITGGVAQPFVHRVDIHYQSTNIATVDKAPGFYTQPA